MVVSDTLPGGVAHVLDDGGANYDHNTGRWDVGDLANGERATLHITATVEVGTAGDTIVNTAVITETSRTDPESSNDVAHADIEPQGANLEVVKMVDNSTPKEGETITYAITVTNHGPADTIDVVISDTLPVSVTHVSDDDGGGGLPYDETTGVWTVGDLDESNSRTLHITVTVDVGTAGVVITNTAVVSESGRTDLFSDNDKAHALIAVQEVDAVIVTGTPEEGGTLIYTDAEGLTTTVKVPAGAVTDPVNLVYTPLPASTHPAPDGMRFVGNVFSLDIYLDAVLQPGYTSNLSITITIHYSDEDVAEIDEETLVLEYWNGETWEDAACGLYDRHPDENWLAVPICHLSEFSLFNAVTSFPVGGYTEPMSLPALLWPLILLTAAVVTVSLVVVLLKRRAA